MPRSVVISGESPDYHVTLTGSIARPSVGSEKGIRDTAGGVEPSGPTDKRVAVARYCRPSRTGSNKRVGILRDQIRSCIRPDK